MVCLEGLVDLRQVVGSKLSCYDQQKNPRVGVSHSQAQHSSAMFSLLFLLGVDAKGLFVLNKKCELCFNPPTCELC